MLPFESGFFLVCLENRRSGASFNARDYRHENARSGRELEVSQGVKSTKRALDVLSTTVTQLKATGRGYHWLHV